MRSSFDSGRGTFGPGRGRGATGTRGRGSSHHQRKPYTPGPGASGRGASRAPTPRLGRVANMEMPHDFDLDDANAEAFDEADAFADAAFYDHYDAAPGNF